MDDNLNLNKNLKFTDKKKTGVLNFNHFLFFSK